MESEISSFCTAGNRVEVAHSPAGHTANLVVIVRDAKGPLRAESITFHARAWSAFLTGARNGEFAAD